MIDGWKHWPRDAELWWYTEDYDVPETAGVKTVPVSHLQQLTDLKRRYGKYVPPAYIWDVVRFSHKVFAAIDALSDYRGIGVWLDADCVTHNDIPDGYIENMLEKESYIGIFRRDGMYTETGFWVMDCSHPVHNDFLQTWAGWYDSGGFATLGGWTDCHTLDATIRKFKGQIKVTNLSGEHSSNMHPMSQVDLAKYIDHCKGPRKLEGFSPENAHREAA